MAAGSHVRDHRGKSHKDRHGHKPQHGTGARPEQAVDKRRGEACQKRGGDARDERCCHGWFVGWPGPGGGGFRPHPFRQTTKVFRHGRMSTQTEKKAPENYGKEERVTVAAFLPWRGWPVRNP
jgi:hypothetical protein